MNPFEVERLGWDSIRGLPIRPNPNLGTGSFRIVCGREEGLPSGGGDGRGGRRPDRPGRVDAFSLNLDDCPSFLVAWTVVFSRDADT